jgi:hypothetical protein
MLSNFKLCVLFNYKNLYLVNHPKYTAGNCECRLIPLLCPVTGTLQMLWYPRSDGVYYYLLLGSQIPGPKFCNRFQGIDSSSLCRLAGRNDNPIPTRFLSPIDCYKIPALTCTSSCLVFTRDESGQKGIFEYFAAGWQTKRERDWWTRMNSSRL